MVLAFCCRLCCNKPPQTAQCTTSYKFHDDQQCLPWKWQVQWRLLCYGTGNYCSTARKVRSSIIPRLISQGNTANLCVVGFNTFNVNHTSMIEIIERRTAALHVCRFLPLLFMFYPIWLGSDASFSSIPLGIAVALLVGRLDGISCSD